MQTEEEGEGRGDGGGGDNGEGVGERRDKNTLGTKPQEPDLSAACCL